MALRSSASRRSAPLSEGRSRGTAVVALFSITLFLSAGLLFLIQPMFAKFVLPLFGSTPGVWNASMLFFQTALLGGYLYAHLTSRWLDVKRQSILHFVLFVLSFLTLPVAIASGWQPTGGEAPVWWLVGLLTVSLGAPFFMLSTAGQGYLRGVSDLRTPLKILVIAHAVNVVLELLFVYGFG